MNQNQMVLDYITDHGSIDPIRALTELGIMRLGARIFELKAQGVPIVGEMRTNPITKKRWKEYRLG